MRRPHIPWTAIAAAVAALALLSAAQIYLRQRAAGESPSWWWAVTTNLLAWWPWALLAPAVLGGLRRVPLPPWRSLRVHVPAAALVAAVYLLYLTAFWFVVFPDIMGRPSAGSFLAAYGDALGEFFLIAFVGYWLIVAVGAGADAFARSRETAQLASAEPATLATSRPRRLEIRSRGRVRYVDVEEIDWIGAEGSYVRIHAGESSWLLRRTLSGLVEELGDGFARIHRSTVVRLDRVRELRTTTHGEAIACLTSGHELKVSRSYRGQVEPQLASS